MYTVFDQQSFDPLQEIWVVEHAGYVLFQSASRSRAGSAHTHGQKYPKTAENAGFQ